MTDQEAITSFREDDDGDLLRSELVTTPDNATLSEELSRFSSSPSQSQSSSCTSITNPFYDGPANPAPSLPVMSAPSAALSISVAHDTSPRQQAIRSNPSVDHVTGSRRISRASGRESSYTGYFPEEDEEEEDHRHPGTLARQESKLQQRVILVWNFGYLATCGGFLQVLQLVNICILKVSHRCTSNFSLP